MTLMAMSGDQEKALAAERIGYTTKPVNRLELLARTRSLITVKRLEGLVRARDDDILLMDLRMPGCTCISPRRRVWFWKRG